jgi:hypothetical protein
MFCVERRIVSGKSASPFSSNKPLIPAIRTAWRLSSGNYPLAQSWRPERRSGSITENLPGMAKPGSFIGAPGEPDLRQGGSARLSRRPQPLISVRATESIYYTQIVFHPHDPNHDGAHAHRDTARRPTILQILRISGTYADFSSKYAPHPQERDLDRFLPKTPHISHGSGRTL